MFIWWRHQVCLKVFIHIDWHHTANNIYYDNTVCCNSEHIQINYSLDPQHFANATHMLLTNASLNLRHHWCNVSIKTSQSAGDRLCFFSRTSSGYHEGLYFSPTLLALCGENPSVSSGFCALGIYSNLAQVYIYLENHKSTRASMIMVWHPSGHSYVCLHYDDVIMTMLASQITSLAVVYSIVYSGVNQRKHQSSASLAFVREIHRGPVNFPHKWPVTRKMFPFDDVIMIQRY